MPTLNLATSGIVDQALRFAEVSAISSFGDDSAMARDVAASYATALAECLEAADWSFASTLSTLPALAVLPDGAVADADLPWLFALPPGLVALREVGNGRTAWRRDDAGIRADEAGPLRVRYTRRIDAEATLPAAFRRAVAARLATLLAPRWGGATGKTQWLEDLVAASLKEAMRGDARQASSLRYDGGAEAGDWVAEARA
jgi:hypothetical protein